MNSEQDLLQKLMVSKKIMDRHNDIGRGNARNISSNDGYSSPMVESYEAIPAQYNIPQEFMQETQRPVTQSNSNVPIGDRIANSKLPDEIKRLMMEHPIQQPTMGMSSGAVLSDELVEKASRLMNKKSNQQPISENKRQQAPTQQTQQTQNSLSADDIRSIVRETMEEVLHENGLLVESESKSNEMFKFRVGQHLFEGKVVKIKKIAK
jgi:hypothetical protein